MVPGQMPDAVRGGGAKEDKEVSNGRSRRGYGFSMRGTLDIEKEIPISRPRCDCVKRRDLPVRASLLVADPARRLPIAIRLRHEAVSPGTSLCTGSRPGKPALRQNPRRR